MERITSRKNPLLEHMRRLDSAAFRRQQGEFLCDSPKLVGEALRHGARVLAVAVSDGEEPPEMKRHLFIIGGASVLPVNPNIR